MKMRVHDETWKVQDEESHVGHSSYGNNGDCEVKVE